MSFKNRGVTSLSTCNFLNSFNAYEHRKCVLIILAFNSQGNASMILLFKKGNFQSFVFAKASDSATG